MSDESEAALALQVRYPGVEVSSRPGWEDAKTTSRIQVAQLEVAEPMIATTWFEEEIHEAFLKIIDRESRDVVTVIEILSPTNKNPGSAGR